MASINITIHNPKITYTTLDRVEGVVTITAPVDTIFEDIIIELIGISRTYVDALATAVATLERLHAFRRFLTLSQPDVQEHYPEDKILKAWKPYKVPFVFVVPQQLLPSICHHAVETEVVQSMHCRLPPTFGDRDPGNRLDNLDDMAPFMARIRYSILATITSVKSRDDAASRSIVVSEAKALRVLPAADQQPPLYIRDEDGDYVPRKEKTIKNGFLGRKLGTLVMEAEQPQPLCVHFHNDEEGRKTTIMRLLLRFDPFDEKCFPPRLGSLASKLIVTTHFTTTGHHTFPSKQASTSDMSKGFYTETLNISSRCVANIEWIKKFKHHEQGTQQDSATEMPFSHTEWNPEPSESYKGESYFVARLLVPIIFPEKKVFVPTFHSCLVSRVYVFKFNLNIRTGGVGCSISVKVPVQVSSGASVDNRIDDGESVGPVNQTENVIELDTNYETTQPLLEGFMGLSGVGGRARPVDDEPPAYSSLLQRRVRAQHSGGRTMY